MISNYLINIQNKIDEALEEHLQQQKIVCPRLKACMYYALFSGGKRIRPMISYLSGLILELPEKINLAIACAIEWTHTYSLIHDDLPAMDNDDFRRGQPTCHKKFDEATAILAGDALQISAIKVLSSLSAQELSANIILALINCLIDASGTAGMISGQSLDIQNQATTSDDHRLISELKTGKLIQASVNLSIIASNTQSNITSNLDYFAKTLGEVFQLQDDYMDVYCPKKLGKDASSDSINQKLTSARLFNQIELNEKIKTLYTTAENCLNHISINIHNTQALEGLLAINNNLANRHLLESHI
jgi:farnesyl diphosphate synthase